ncbi:hypothetical protein HPB50_019134 [Hyalomma asiaticum]|uniref:Uncharacterized protein n=1 Tax=Hyalomma asiaticum TaxID=266040 RepID=A0ACB7SIP4_HYAAI|nr:hypothetical protein HPB50_019134 [Hyalomma asiaticum]
MLFAALAETFGKPLECTMEDWENFKKAYNKVYETKVEEERRRRIFCLNKFRIDINNMKYERRNSTRKEKVDRTADMEDSSGISKKDDHRNESRNLALMLLFCLMGVVPGTVASALLTVLMHRSGSSDHSPTANRSVSRTTASSTQLIMPACATDDCEHLADWLRLKVDQNMDPCDDFYRFVCDDYENLLPFVNLEFDINRISISAAQATSIPAVRQSAWEKAVALFRACLAFVEDGRNETSELISWMTSIGLDLNNLAPSDPFDPVDMIARCSLEFGIPVLFKIHFSGVVLTNNKRRLSPEWNELLEGPVEEMAILTEPVITAEMWNKSLAKHTKNMYHGSDVIDYVKVTPQLLAGILGSKDIGVHGMRGLMAYSLFNQLVDFTKPEELVKNESPENSCYKRASKVMGPAITSRFIYSAVLSKKTLTGVEEMLSNLRKAYQAAINSSSWMTGSARETALRKLHNMRQHVGGLGKLQDGAFIENYYASFPDVPTDQFFNPWREATGAAMRQAWADPAIILSKQMVNAFYLPFWNEMVVLPAIMLPDAFFTEGPSAFNYGSLGMVIGHEIMHGYDVVGSQFDEHANHRPFFSPESTKHYVNNTLCLRNVHRRVHPLARQAALNDTVDSENLADFVGTLMAYSAFSSLPPSKRDVTLPGVGMTANQLFFVSHCTLWCEGQKTTSMRYAPGRSRCIVPLMNMPEFSEAFRCKEDSYMNPPNKCYFWT